MLDRTKLLLVCSAVAVLCACSTPYQEMGLMGGVSATQIDANTMRISSRGNGFSDIGRMKDYVLLKAAQETQARGYTLFYVMDSENVTRHDTFTTTQTHFAPVMGTAVTPMGPVTTFGTAQYQTESTHNITRPGEDIVIKMESGAKPYNSPANLYSAAEVIAYLGPSVLGDRDAAPPPPVQPAPAVVASGQSDFETPPPKAVCTDRDRQMAQLAKKNGFQYDDPCP